MNDRTMLQFDYDNVHGGTVTAVLGASDSGGGWEAIAIVIETRALISRVDPDTDEITVCLETAPVQTDGRWRPIGELAFAVGEALGWCWIGRNYRGYLDMFTVSVSGIEPQFAFVAAASMLSIRRLVPVG